MQPKSTSRRVINRALDSPIRMLPVPELCAAPAAPGCAAVCTPPATATLPLRLMRTTWLVNRPTAASTATPSTIGSSTGSKLASLSLGGAGDWLPGCWGFAGDSGCPCWSCCCCLISCRFVVRFASSAKPATAGDANLQTQPAQADVSNDLQQLSGEGRCWHALHKCTRSGVCCQYVRAATMMDSHTLNANCRQQV
jgi:hypothetical protein